MNRVQRVASVAILIVTTSALLWFVGADSARESIGRSTAGQVHSPTVDTPENESLQIVWETEFSLRRLNVKWRDPEKQELVSPPYGQHYEPLRARALNGDSVAASLLYQILEECRPAFDDRNAMNIAFDGIRQTHSIQLPSWEKPRRIRNPEALEEFIQSTERDFESCYPITAAQKDESRMWLRQAAEGGNMNAILYFGRYAEGAEESIDWLERAWRSGQPESLELLGAAHLKSYDRGDDPEGHIDSFAHQYAYTQLLWASSSLHGVASFGQYQNAISKLTYLSSRLHDHERIEAVKRAGQLIENNPNCCVRF